MALSTVKAALLLLATGASALLLLEGFASSESVLWLCSGSKAAIEMLTAKPPATATTISMSVST